LSDLPVFPEEPRQKRWRIRGGPASPAARFLLAVIVAPPIGLILAHAPLLLLVITGPLGWSLMAAGFALALGAAAVMYGAMLLLGLPLLLLLAWRRVQRPAVYGLAGAAVGLVTGLWLADWVGSDPSGVGAVLLGLGLGVYGGWLGLCMGVVAGMILLAAELQQRHQAAQGVIIEQERDPD